MSPARVASAFMTGILLLQVAWTAAVPPYRGSDEFDHVYRAASVALGYWKPDPVQARDGRGALTPVPRALVTDGTPVCSKYKYTGHDNCNPVEDLGGGLVTVASAATLYNPVYYWVIGTPARVVEGVWSLYVMRSVASLLCLMLLWLAAWVTATWSRTRWPLASLMLALTPVAIYSTVVPAANGLEIAAALCLWQALLGLATPTGRAHAARLVVVGAAASAVLLEVRILGPLWWLIALGTTAVALGPLLLGRSLLADRRVAAGALIVAGIAGATGITWTLRSRQATALEAAQPTFEDPWLPSLEQIPLWVFQSVAAFPVRNEQAPTVVYAAGLVTLLGFVGLGLHFADTRLRLTTGLLVLASLGIPLVITLQTILTSGPIWQGRYTLPVASGIILVAGLALERADFRHRLGGPVLVAFGLCVLVMHLVSVVSVHSKELATSPLAGDDRWLTMPPWLVGAIATAGVICLWYAVLRVAQPLADATHEGQPEAQSSSLT